MSSMMASVWQGKFLLFSSFYRCFTPADPRKISFIAEKSITNQCLRHLPLNILVSAARSGSQWFGQMARAICSSLSFLQSGAHNAHCILTQIIFLSPFFQSLHPSSPLSPAPIFVVVILQGIVVVIVAAGAAVVGSCSACQLCSTVLIRTMCLS